MRITILILVAFLTGCGKSAGEKKLEADLVAAQASLAEVTDKLAKANEEIESLGSQITWLQKQSESKSNFELLPAQCKAHFSLPDNGAFTFSDGKAGEGKTKLLAAHPDNIGMLEFIGNDKGKVSSISMLIFFPKDLTQDGMQSRLTVLTKVIDLIKAPITEADIDGLVAGQMFHSRKKDGLTVARKWGDVDVRAFDAMAFGAIGVVFRKSAD